MTKIPIGGSQGSKTKNCLALIAEYADIVDASGNGIRDDPPYTTFIAYLNELKWREAVIEGIHNAELGTVVEKRIYAFLDDWVEKAIRMVAESGGAERAVLTYNSKDLPQLPSITPSP